MLHVLVLYMLPTTVVSDTGCTLSSTQGEDKSRSYTGMGGTFLSWLPQNKREELQDNKTKVTHTLMRLWSSESHIKYHPFKGQYNFMVYLRDKAAGRLDLPVIH